MLFCDFGGFILVIFLGFEDILIFLEVMTIFWSLWVFEGYFNQFKIFEDVLVILKLGRLWRI
jgi:hypothetical protein